MTTTDTTNNAPAYEETHAARCLSLYLNNTADIYDRYTVPAIADATTGIKHHGKLFAQLLNSGAITSADNVMKCVNAALQAAARLVQKYDHMTPTAADIEAVQADYVAYIIECAQYEVNNA